MTVFIQDPDKKMNQKSTTLKEIYHKSQCEFFILYFFILFLIYFSWILLRQKVNYYRQLPIMRQ